MIVSLDYKNKKYWIDLSQPIDISIPTGRVKCFYAPDFRATPYVSGDFIGSVKAGAPVNFYNVHCTPHGNGTHTECLGHITEKQESVNQQLQQYHHIAYLVSVDLEKRGGDEIITENALAENCPNELPNTLIIRTLPNTLSKLSRDYSGTNPPYLHEKVMKFITKKGIEHLLIDLPSVDKEKDNGLLVGHRIFWNLNHQANNNKPRAHCTITEMVFIDNAYKDGLYFINLQIAPFDLDASPSKPVLYKMTTFLPPVASIK